MSKLEKTYAEENLNYNINFKFFDLLVEDFNK